MSIAKEVFERLQNLPVDDQDKILHQIEELERNRRSGKSRKSSKGILAHLGAHISEEDIAEVRREMWGNFPRDFPTDCD